MSQTPMRLRQLYTNRSVNVYIQPMPGTVLLFRYNKFVVPL